MFCRGRKLQSNRLQKLGLCGETVRQGGPAGGRRGGLQGNTSRTQRYILVASHDLQQGPWLLVQSRGETLLNILKFEFNL